MKELMVHVERVVRPQQMSVKQKLKMREELLGHLRGIYDEEFERLNDRDAAVRAAIERLGHAAELSEKLHSAVPWYDFVLRLPRSVWKLTLCACVITVVCLLPALSVASRIFNGRWFGSEELAVWVLTATVLPAVAAYFFGFAGAIHGVLDHAKSYRGAMCYSVGFFCYLTVGGQFLTWPTPLFQFAYAGLWTGIVAAASYGFGRPIREEERRLREWELLSLA